MIGTSLFIAFLDRGAGQITTTFNIDSSFPDIVIGIVLFFIIGCEFFIGYQLKFKSREEKEEIAAPGEESETVVEESVEGGNE
jgi:simple sugar transport system permease protein